MGAFEKSVSDGWLIKLIGTLIIVSNHERSTVRWWNKRPFIESLFKYNDSIEVTNTKNYSSILDLFYPFQGTKKEIDCLFQDLV